jgi:DNA topoisomerase-1
MREKVISRLIIFLFTFFHHRIIIMKTLLIVESPAKSKTIEKLLGKDYIVKASFGHIRDLDQKEMGIEVENRFRPVYKILSKSSKHVAELKDVVSRVDRVLLASDEDREGEAIAWHCAVVLKIPTNQANRICFHEITETALRRAVENPRMIDMNMVNSQQARRILDRLVGFEISPLLWKSVGAGLSAGRVQSVCLKLIVQKEKEVEEF